jgi:hypothetical protein
MTNHEFELRQTRLSDKDIDLLFMAIGEEVKKDEEFLKDHIEGIRSPEMHDRILRAFEHLQVATYHRGELSGLKAERAFEFALHLARQQDKKMQEVPP